VEKRERGACFRLNQSRKEKNIRKKSERTDFSEGREIVAILRRGTKGKEKKEKSAQKREGLRLNDDNQKGISNKKGLRNPRKKGH